jgi:hypothetical protein
VAIVVESGSVLAMFRRTPNRIGLWLVGQHSRAVAPVPHVVGQSACAKVNGGSTLGLPSGAPGPRPLTLVPRAIRPWRPSRGAHIVTLSCVIRKSSIFDRGPQLVMASTRRLAAILAADVAGYSRLMGADETGTVRALREHCAPLIRSLPSMAGGSSKRLVMAY